MHNVCVYVFKSLGSLQYLQAKPDVATKWKVAPLETFETDAHCSKTTIQHSIYIITFDIPDTALPARFIRQASGDLVSRYSDHVGLMIAGSVPTELSLFNWTPDDDHFVLYFGLFFIH